MADLMDNASIDSSDSNSYTSEYRYTTRSSTKENTIDRNNPPAHITRRVNLTANKFMENFNPETSARERRKLHRKLTTTGGKKNPGAIFDEHGSYISTGQNICDCLLTDCPGCFFPCPKCGSEKCGSECRVNRKYAYEQVDFEGCNINVKNTHGK